MFGIAKANPNIGISDEITAQGTVVRDSLLLGSYSEYPFSATCSVLDLVILGVFSIRWMRLSRCFDIFCKYEVLMEKMII